MHSLYDVYSNVNDRSKIYCSIVQNCSDIFKTLKNHINLEQIKALHIYLYTFYHILLNYKPYLTFKIKKNTIFLYSVINFSFFCLIILQSMTQESKNVKYFALINKCMCVCMYERILMCSFVKIVS